MAYNFYEHDWDQGLLLPEDMREWVPEGDLAHFVIDVVKELDLSEFLSRYRSDGWGAVAYDPRMMVALTIYAYCVGERSSRRIEKLCGRDAGFRLIAGNQIPDHSTIARFRKDHEEAALCLFGQVLTVCARAGLVKPDVIAIDGTKIKANASLDANRTYESLKKEYEELARRMMEEADRVDEEEDRIYGPDRRGDEMPEELRDAEGRLALIRECLDEINREAEKKAGEQQKKVDEYREKREAGEKRRGRKPLPPEVVRERSLSKVKVNTSDPSSRIMKGPRGYVQGFNAQIAVTGDQIIVAAELTDSPDDWHLLHPMVELAKDNLKEAGVEEEIGIALADAGYGSEKNLAEAESIKKEAQEKGEPDSYPEFFVATEKDRLLAARMKQAAAGEEDRDARGEACRESSSQDENGTAVERMKEKLLTGEGRKAYAIRGKTVEPVFGQMKDTRGFERFMRRGLEACKSEWMLMCSSHNLLKLWRKGLAVAEIG